MIDLVNLLGASAGGIFPALVWLWFWLREDREHPEPKRLIVLAFLAGAIAVGVVIPIEQFTASAIADHRLMWQIGRVVSAWLSMPTPPNDQTLTFIFWAAIEELTKFAAAAVAVLWTHDDDEPIDPVIYMVVVALGFAAAENALFLLSPLSGNTLAQTIITGDYRFVGANLLHVLASAVIGGSIALSFYKRWRIKWLYIFCGVILAISLHGLFNVLIMNAVPQQMIEIFSLVWAGLIGLIAFLEFIKRMPKQPESLIQ